MLGIKIGWHQPACDVARRERLAIAKSEAQPLGMREGWVPWAQETEDPI